MFPQKHPNDFEKTSTCFLYPAPAPYLPFRVGCITRLSVPSKRFVFPEAPDFFVLPAFLSRQCGEAVTERLTYSYSTTIITGK